MVIGSTPPEAEKKNMGMLLGVAAKTLGTKWVTSLHTPENYNIGNPKRVTLQPRLETKKNPFEPSKPPSSGNKNIFIFQGVDPGSVLF